MSSDWVSCHLDDFLEFANGKLSPERLDGGSYQVFGSNGAIGRCHESNAPPETTIIGRVGSYCGSIHYSKYSCWVTDNAIKSIPRRSHNARFCYYLLNSLNLWRLREGSGQPLINQSILGSIRVSLPPLIEQKTIAHILGTLDDKIELNRKTNETLEAIAKALFKSWFVDFDPVRAKAEGRLTGLPAEISDLFPDSFEKSELGEIPRGWRVQAFGSLLSISRDSINPSDTPLELFDHYSIPAYDSGCKPSKEFGESIKSQKFLVEDDSLLVSKLNPSTPRVWIPYSSGTRRRICSTEFLVCRTFQGVGRSFAYCLASSDPIIETMIGLAGGTSNSHQRIRPEDFLNLTCCPGNEQVRTVFCSLVDPIMNSVLWNKQESVDLGQMRDTLLPKLISGELRIPDAEALVAEAGI